MQTGMVTLETSDGPMAAYEASPEIRRGGVVVVQEAFGVNEHIEDIAKRLAAEGYHAVAPALYHRAGGNPVVPYDDMSSIMQYMGGLDDDAILTDIDAALDHLRATGLDDASIGVVGFCMGGRVSFLVAARRTLGAAVGFYGGGIVTSRRPASPALVGEAATLATPWLGLFGDADASIPVDDVEALRAALTSVPVDSDVVRYPDAEHGFHCDARPAYHPEAAADGWSRTLAWFDAHLQRVS